MKSFLFALMLCLSVFTYGQQSQLWGTTFLGGEQDAGFIFKLNPDGSDYEIVHVLDGEAGGRHMGAGLLLASDGLLYGMTSQGGNFDRGLIFSIEPETGTFSIRHHFENTQPFQSAFMQAANGKLYAMIAEGIGGVISFDPETDELEIVYLFTDRAQGAHPLPDGALIETAANVLTGITASGGENNDGVIFQLMLETGAYSILHHFDRSEGRFPKSGLLLATDGGLYGIGSSGGNNGQGVLFCYDLASKQYEVKVHLTNAFALANGGLIEADNGKLYGTASIGGDIFEGAIFEYDPATESADIKVSFNGVNGTLPDAPLMEASNGKLYGITRYGGSGEGLGVVYQFDPETGDLETIQSLDDGFPTGTILVEVESPVVTSLEPLSQKVLSVYPNPVSDFMYLSTSQGPLPNHVSLYNQTGQKVYEAPLTEDRLDFSALPPGFYILSAAWPHKKPEAIHLIKK